MEEKVVKTKVSHAQSAPNADETQKIKEIPIKCMNKDEEEEGGPNVVQYVWYEL